MKQNFLFHGFAGLFVGMFGAVLGLSLLQYAFAAPTQAPPLGNPTYPLQGPTGNTGPQGPKGDKGDPGRYTLSDIQLVSAPQAYNAVVSCPSGYMLLTCFQYSESSSSNRIDQGILPYGNNGCQNKYERPLGPLYARCLRIQF